MSLFTAIRSPHCLTIANTIPQSFITPQTAPLPTYSEHCTAWLSDPAQRRETCDYWNSRCGRQFCLRTNTSSAHWASSSVGLTPAQRYQLPVTMSHTISFAQDDRKDSMTWRIGSYKPLTSKSDAATVAGIPTTSATTSPASSTPSPTVIPPLVLCP